MFPCPRPSGTDPRTTCPIDDEPRSTTRRTAELSSPVTDRGRRRSAAALLVPSPIRSSSLRASRTHRRSDVGVTRPTWGAAFDLVRSRAGRFDMGPILFQFCSNRCGTAGGLRSAQGMRTNRRSNVNVGRTAAGLGSTADLIALTRWVAGSGERTRNVARLLVVAGGCIALVVGELLLVSALIDVAHTVSAFVGLAAGGTAVRAVGRVRRGNRRRRAAD